MSDDPMNIERMISEMNSSMPINRRSLSDYLENGDYTYLTRDGITGSIDKAEIEYLSSVCTEVEKLRLRIPIFVSTDTSYSGGAWKVDGKVEAAVIARVLGKKLHREDFLRLYFPDLKDIRKVLPSTVVTIFLP